MAWYRPLQRVEGNGKWYYTCTDGSGVYEIGYCVQTELCPECRKDWDTMYDDKDCSFCNNRRFIDKENACQGHNTANEAIEHYRQYKLDKSEVRVDPDVQKKCELCGTWTQKFMDFGANGWFDQYYLCEEHCNKEGLDSLTKNPKLTLLKAPKFKRDWNDVPKTLQEAMEVLDRELEEETKNKVRNYTDPQYKIKMAQFDDLPDHFCCYIVGGMGMRNGWGLWSDSPLAHWFRSRGIFHADDMSAIVGTAYYHHLIGDKEVNDEWMISERQYYDAYWTASKCPIPTYEEWLKELEKDEDSN